MPPRDRTEVDRREAEKPEAILEVRVFFHVDKLDEPEVRDRVSQIKHVIETALEDEDNDIRGFTYPEVEVSLASR